MKPFLRRQGKLLTALVAVLVCAAEQLRPTGGFRLRHPLGPFSATPLA